MVKRRTVDPKDLIDLLEAGRLLGVSHVTVWRWTKAGKIPAFDIAGRVLLLRSDVLKHKERGRD
jgi:excisionase family DNA binding protein